MIRCSHVMVVLKMFASSLYNRVSKTNLLTTDLMFPWYNLCEQVNVKFNMVTKTTFQQGSVLIGLKLDQMRYEEIS